MDEVNFQPGWLRRDVARAAKRMDEWFGGTGMERLSDERLRGIAWEGNSFLASRFEEMAIARELLELRSKLASGPVMPEVPQSELVLDELSRVMSWERAIEMYADIRTALLKEQSR